MTVAETQADESITNKEAEKDVEQVTDVPLMEKPSASQIRETLNLLFNFSLLAGNKEMHHIMMRASKMAEMELSWRAQ